MMKNQPSAQKIGTSEIICTGVICCKINESLKETIGNKIFGKKQNRTTKFIK